MNTMFDMCILRDPCRPNTWVGAHPTEPGKFMPTVSIGAVIFFTKPQAKKYIEEHGNHVMIDTYDFMRDVHRHWCRNEH